MFRRWKDVPHEKTFFTEGEWEAIETVAVAAALMDRTPSEMLDAAYDGPSDQSVEFYLDS